MKTKPKTRFNKIDQVNLIQKSYTTSSLTQGDTNN
jgi:hypothetical protein